ILDNRKAHLKFSNCILLNVAVDDALSHVAIGWRSCILDLPSAGYLLPYNRIDVCQFVPGLYVKNEPDYSEPDDRADYNDADLRRGEPMIPVCVANNSGYDRGSKNEINNESSKCQPR